MVTITLYARQQKRHRCIEQSFGLCGRGRGWDDLGERHYACIISYMKRIASPGSMHDTGCLGSFLKITLCKATYRSGSGDAGIQMKKIGVPYCVSVSVILSLLLTGRYACCLLCWSY